MIMTVEKSDKCGELTVRELIRFLADKGMDKRIFLSLENRDVEFGCRGADAAAVGVDVSGDCIILIARGSSFEVPDIQYCRNRAKS